MPTSAKRTGRGARRAFFWTLKHTLNRVTIALARSGHGPFSLIRHVGRRSGRIYETPVILAVVPDGFVAELTYGERVDWYRNVVAAGGCVVARPRSPVEDRGVEQMLHFRSDVVTLS